MSQDREQEKIDPELEQEIVESVGHRLSLSLRLLILNASTEVVQDALKILQTGKNIKNKAGLLRRAIENKWKPSAAAIAPKFKLDPEFDQWWKLAKQQGIVIGSERRDNQLWVYDAQAQAIPYDQMRQLFPLESLRAVAVGVTDRRGMMPQKPRKLAMPMDLSDVLAQIRVHFARLQWTAAQVREFLQQTYGKTSHVQLDDDQLYDLQIRLETLA